ncbi:MAG: metallophosphoesterase [Bacteroidales bacterium]|nr:metallophosphoesterase [Bacteroidales bacterium]
MNKLVPFLILLTTLSIIVIAIIYLSRRFTWIIGAESIRPFYIIFTTLIIGTFASMIIFMHTTSPIGHILYFIFTILLGYLLFLLFSMIIIDLVNLIFHFKPFWFGIIVISLSVLITGYGIINASNIHTNHINLELSNLDKNYRIVHLSDIHMGQFRGQRFLKKIVAKTNFENPDLVLITGDYADSRYALKPQYFESLKNINAPVLFVNGNHDKNTGDKQIKDLLKRYDVKVLENEVFSFEGLQIVGLNHMLADTNSLNMHATAKSQTIKSVLSNLELDKASTKILMHHSPDGIEYADKAGIDIYLSGHTHAGQLFPIIFINELIFDYNKGLHKKGNTSIFVSQGIGTFGPPIRIGTHSEIVVFDLIAK